MENDGCHKKSARDKASSRGSIEKSFSVHVNFAWEPKGGSSVLDLSK